MKMNDKFLFLLIIIGQLLFYGCANARGPLFQEVPLGEHEGKTIVYFYRDPQASTASTYDLRINKEKTLPLQNKGYHLLILDPGTYNFAVSYKSELRAEKTFTLQGNRVYYIRYRADVVRWKQEFFGCNPIIKHDIVSVPKDEAMEALQKCRLIETPRE